MTSTKFSTQTLECLHPKDDLTKDVTQRVCEFSACLPNEHQRVVNFLTLSQLNPQDQVQLTRQLDPQEQAQLTRLLLLDEKQQFPTIESISLLPGVRGELYRLQRECRELSLELAIDPFDLMKDTPGVMKSLRRMTEKVLPELVRVIAWSGTCGTKVLIDILKKKKGDVDTGFTMQRRKDMVSAESFVRWALTDASFEQLDEVMALVSVQCKETWRKTLIDETDLEVARWINGNNPKYLTLEERLYIIIASTQENRKKRENEIELHSKSRDDHGYYFLIISLLFVASSLLYNFSNNADESAKDGNGILIVVTTFCTAGIFLLSLSWSKVILNYTQLNSLRKTKLLLFTGVIAMSAVLCGASVYFNGTGRINTRGILSTLVYVIPPSISVCVIYFCYQHRLVKAPGS